MATERSGGGDPRRGLALLWRATATPPGTGTRPPRGRRPKLTVDQIVAAAVAVADRDGLEAMSMSRVAAELGTSTMSLYTYVPGKAELIDLMVDAVMVERDLPGPGSPDLPDGWRARVELYAERTLRAHRRHPWFGQVSTVRPPLGPGLMSESEYLLSALVAAGLAARQANAAASAIATHVGASAAQRVENERVEATTGQSDDAWWAARQHVWEEYFDMDQYPTLTQVFIAVDTAADDPPMDGAPDDPEDPDFGLRRMLDGIETLVAATGATDEEPHG